MFALLNYDKQHLMLASVSSNFSFWAVGFTFLLANMHVKDGKFIYAVLHSLFCISSTPLVNFKNLFASI